MKTIILAHIGTDKTIAFAAHELAKYLRLIDSTAVVDERICKKHDPSKPYIWVGLDNEFPIDTASVPDRELDDAIYIDVNNFKGIISGVNTRAVLIAAYRFIRELGVAFIRPTGDGEVIPQKVLDDCNVKISEAPSYRHRAVCIEGACSYEHAYYMIDWIPKVGMNGYMIQFANPVHYFERWYQHEWIPEHEKFPIDKEDGYAIKEKLERELSERSLLYHAVGHGWTAMHLGNGLGDEFSMLPLDIELTEEQSKYLALVDGKRKLFVDKPEYTELCYSNLKAQDAFIDAVVNHCEKYPEITHVHAWLSDGTGNKCQCENCKEKSPSDYYVQMLNRLDERLTEKGIKTKVVFLLYHETLWAPVVEQIKNKDRFVMMFAPSCRSHAQTFANVDIENHEPIPELDLVNINYPKTASGIVAMFNDWRDKSPVGDYFQFDYHLWAIHLSDAGYTGIARVLFEDVCSLDRLNINGFVSCQVQRACFPSNLPMHAMASGLWNKHADYAEVCEDYYKNAFGDDYIAVKNYLEALTELISPMFVMGDDFARLTNAERTDRAQKAVKVIDSFEKVIKEKLENTKWEHEAQRLSWFYLAKHCDIARKEAHYVSAKSSGAPSEEFEKVKLALRNAAWEIEDEVHKTFDVWRFTGSCPYLFNEIIL